MSDRMSDRTNVGAWMFGLCLVFLAFVAGVLAMVTETPPAGFIRDAYRAADALYVQRTSYGDRFTTDLWNKARDDRRGVTVLNAERASPGLTLYTSGDAAKAELVDLRGNIVHQWQRPYSTVWDPSSPVRHPVPDDHVYFRKAQMLPDGSLIALYEGVGDTPYGYGLAKLTANSALIWKNLDNFHHDFDTTPDGRIVALTQSFRTTALEGADQFKPPYLEDSLVMVGADGHTLSKISLLDALNESPFRSLLWRVPYYTMEDPIHANGVDYLDRERAQWLQERIPAAREGQVLVSFRELAGGSVALVDPKTGKVAWASHGPWLAQHDPDVLPGGLLEVFDNRGNLGHTSKSRVLVVDPATLGIVWSYAGDSQHPLDSPIRGAVQRLPNDDTLITESGGGRLLEVTRDGHIVWEYLNPVRGGKEDDLIPVVSWGQRIAPENVPPSFVPQIAEHP